MRDDTVRSFLERLADRVPAPGGGAVAGLHLAEAGALVAMVARYSDGRKYDAHRAVLERILLDADEVRSAALDLAEQDMAAFGAVAAAYRLPRDTEQDRAVRSAAIADAVRAAAQPPAGVVAVAGRVVALAEQLLPVGNRTVVTDVGAAAEAARAAAITARMNVEVNLAGIADHEERRRLGAIVDAADIVARRAEVVSTAVRALIAG